MSTDPQPEIDAIIKIMRVTRSQMYGRSRAREDTWPRHLCWWVLIAVFGYTNAHVARIWKCDHKTISAGIRSAQNEIETNKLAAGDAAKIIEELCQATQQKNRTE